MVLTASDAAIKRLVGAAKLRRGVALLLQEEVTALVVDGQRLQATVGRLTRAKVQVWFDEPDQPVNASCSLCDGLTGCEHVAAALLGLRNLDQKAPAPAASANPAPAPPRGPRQPAPRRRHGRPAGLGGPGPGSCPGQPRRRPARRGPPVQQLVLVCALWHHRRRAAHRPAPRPAAVSPPPDELIDRALAWLKEEEAAVLQARAAEAEAEVHRKVAPADPCWPRCGPSCARPARPCARRPSPPGPKPGPPNAS